MHSRSDHKIVNTIVFIVFIIYNINIRYHIYLYYIKIVTRRNTDEVMSFDNSSVTP